MRRKRKQTKHFLRNIILVTTMLFVLSVVTLGIWNNVDAGNIALAQTASQSVVSFTLINTVTNQPISGYNPISNGTTLNLATLPTTHLNIRANTSPTIVGSVKFGYDANASYHVENNAPYALASDDNAGHYYSWTPTLGTHTVTATPYTSTNATGTAGTSNAVSFTVINSVPGVSATASPTPTGTSCQLPSGVNGADVLSVSLPTGGSYAIWSRMMVQDSVNNSYFLTIDNQCPVMVVGDSSTMPTGVWTWVNYQNGDTASPIIVNLSQGSHLITLTEREPAVKIDSVLFTQDTTCVPTGFGTNCPLSPTSTPISTPTVTPSNFPSPTISLSPSSTPTNSPTPTTSLSSQAVTSFTLINTVTNQPISGYNPIPNGSTFNLATLPTTHLNIRANTSPNIVGSVRFGYDANVNYHLENNAPYALASDDNAGHYYSWTPTLGNHIVSATPFTASNAGGTAGVSAAVSFTVINSGGTISPTISTSAITGK